MLTYSIESQGFADHRPVHMIKYAEEKTANIVRELFSNIGKFEPETLVRALEEEGIVDRRSKVRKDAIEQTEGRLVKPGLYENVNIHIKWPKVEVLLLGPDA